MGHLLPEYEIVTWKCPNCGHEKITSESRYPWWIMTAVPWSWLWGKNDPPTCDKCGTKMERRSLL